MNETLAGVLVVWAIIFVVFLLALSGRPKPKAKEPLIEEEDDSWLEEDDWKEFGNW